MSKVIDSTTQNWYQEVAPRDYYKEIDLERVIMHNLHYIFPEYIPTMFKDELINNINGKKNKADLCMIKSDYSEWYVIEVELGKHTKNEVIAQIDTFRNCIYTVSNAKYIHNQNISLDFQKLSKLVVNIPPELMVIVNEVKSAWKKDLSKFNCKLCVFQIYNDFDGNRIYRLEGEHPFIYTNFRNCTFEKNLPYAIKILKEDGFLESYGVKNGMPIDIEYNGVKYSWERKDEGNEVYLICKSQIPPLDSLSSRYRLNFYRTGWVKPIKGNLLEIWFKGKFMKQRSVINNSFSFTKD